MVKTRFFGQYLLSKEFITPPQLLAAVEYQEANNSRLGEVAVGLGLLTPFNAEKVNALQAREDRLFGDAAIDLDLLTTEQVQKVLAAQQGAHVRLGQAIEHLEYMTPAAVTDALKGFSDSEGEPDVITIPPGVLDEDVAQALHQLSQKLLLRAWGLPNKPHDLRIEHGPILLSDRNVRLPLGGDLNGMLLVGAPYAAAHKAAQPFAGEVEPKEALLQDIVEQFARVLANNLASVMAERGRRIRPGQPETVQSHLELSESTQTLVIPYITQLGQVLIGLVA